MCDLVHLERRGIPAVGIATEPFADEAIEQARLLAMPDARMLYIPHPVQLLTDAELAARADAIVGAVIAALTKPVDNGESRRLP
ncbi:MAG TPA: hypothetical protein VF843_12650 [Streptosporangiaceae bacterium]